jgi:5-methylcytosine-specific restriction endonuclease McrA
MVGAAENKCTNRIVKPLLNYKKDKKLKSRAFFIQPRFSCMVCVSPAALSTV